MLDSRTSKTKTYRRLISPDIMPSILHVIEGFSFLENDMVERPKVEGLEAGQILVKTEAHSFLLVENKSPLFRNR